MNRRMDNLSLTANSANKPSALWCDLSVRGYQHQLFVQIARTEGPAEGG